MDAAGKYAQKRKKKHLFNESGVAFEPFSLRNDIRDGLVTEDGLVKTSLQEFDRKQRREAYEASDAWLESEQVKTDQERRLKEMQSRQQDSGESESEDELGGDAEEGEAELKEDEPESDELMLDQR